jgi:hypothetical protein
MSITQENVSPGFRVPEYSIRADYHLGETNRSLGPINAPICRLRQGAQIQRGRAVPFIVLAASLAPMNIYTAAGD